MFGLLVALGADFLYNRFCNALKTFQPTGVDFCRQVFLKGFGFFFAAGFRKHRNQNVHQTVAHIVHLRFGCIPYPAYKLAQVIHGQFFVALLQSEVDVDGLFLRIRRRFLLEQHFAETKHTFFALCAVCHKFHCRHGAQVTAAQAFQAFFHTAHAD